MGTSHRNCGSAGQPPKATAEHSAVGMAPENAERVKHNCVSDSQLVRIGHNLTGVVNDWISCQTPGLVVEDPFTVLTGRLRAVPVAVIRN